MGGSVTDYLVENPLLLLFVVVAIGYPLGRLKVRGTSLGVASVLFAGLVVGAIDQDLKLPEILYQFGLVIFVYTIGLSHGRAFFASFRRQGGRHTLLVTGVITIAALLAIGEHALLDLKPSLTAGMFAGSLTNTPALAGELEYLKEYGPEDERDQILAEPIVGYSVAYPIGVLGVILALVVAQRRWRIDYPREAERVRDGEVTTRHLENRTIRVTCPGAAQQSIVDLAQDRDWDVVFARMRHGGRLALVTAETHLVPGDLVLAVGTREDLDRVTAHLGEACDERLELDRSELDFRRIFVSSPAVTGRRLRDLNLRQRFGAVATRIRRGDVEILPHGETVLEPGDRVRVVAPRQSMPAVSSFFGDSYRAISEIDVPTFSLGLTLGLILGVLPIPLPGGVDLKLGLAGGPLIVALILGALDRTGPLVWSLPYSANLTLRQMGLIVFLAGIGTRAGYAFVSTVQGREGIFLLVSGAAITFSVAFSTLWIGYRVLKVPMGLLAGMLAGLQTQPAVLGFALEQSGDDLPNVGYAALFPIATIAKIIAAQLLLALLL
jgi:putative transport protein